MVGPHAPVATFGFIAFYGPNCDLHERFAVGRVQRKRNRLCISELLDTGRNVKQALGGFVQMQQLSG